jgi:DNA polymerase III subunit gamma/tau
MAETSYTVLARKYRPMRFGDLIGQPHIVKALSNAITTGRVAQAFLLTGSRGTGKTSSARILASALNCPNRGEGFEPCGQCPSCVDITHGHDLDVVEMDAASNSRVDDIRERLEGVNAQPARGRYRIFIIDEVHMLSTSAFNALLKTIEEPPAHVKFILATTNPEKIPETILSRCQRYDFRRVTMEEIIRRLEEICEAEGAKPKDGVLRALAEMVEGGMRDALSRLDQLFAFSGLEPSVEDAEKVFGMVSRPRLLDLLEKLSKGDARAGIEFAEDVFDSGKDVAEVLAGLVGLTRSLLLVAADGGESRLVDVPKDELSRIKAVADGFGMEGLVYLAELLTDCRDRVRRAAFPRVVVETTFVKLSLVGRLESLDTLLSRLDEAASESAPAVVAQQPSAPAQQAPAQPPAGAPATPAAKPAEAQPAALSDKDREAVEALKRKFGAK